MQYLILKLEKHKYVYFTRANSEKTTLEDIFFVAVKKRVRFFVNPVDKLDELKAKLDGYFIDIS